MFHPVSLMWFWPQPMSVKKWARIRELAKVHLSMLGEEEKVVMQSQPL